MASACIRDDASITSHMSRASVARVNAPFTSTRSECGSRKEPGRSEYTARRDPRSRDTKFYPLNNSAPPSRPSHREKLSTPAQSTSTKTSDVKSEKEMRSSPVNTRFLFLVLFLCTCGVAGVSVKSTVVQHSFMSALSYLGVTADPELQAKISDLSKQIEDLQKMVTQLIPQQQEKIDLLQQKQDEQQQKQQEQDQREKEQLQAEERRREEEAKKLEEERKKEERQRALELEKIKQLEIQKKQLELEIKLKQEEEERQQWREEMKRKEEEKQRQEEEVREEEEQKKNGEETSDKEAGKTHLENLCSAEKENVCEAETFNSVIEDDSGESVTKTKEELEELIRELEEEKVRLKQEIESWVKFRDKEVQLSEERNSQASQRLIKANELEQKAASESELVKTLSVEMLAKFEELQQENSLLKERITALESGLAGKIESLSSEIEALKKQVDEDEESENSAPATNVQEVKDLINKSLRLYAADEVGMPDFALESSGAVVFTIGETEPYTKDTPWMGVFGISIWRSCKTPRLAIQKDNSPGNCWSFAGDKGSLTIQLSAQVFPEYFTMDHIPLELAPNGNASSAPNHFRVLGLDYGNAPKGHVLGNYEFTEFPIQTFAVQQNPYEKFFRFVKVEVLSNHGNKDYTCLYRFRVHGRPHDTDSYNG